MRTMSCLITGEEENCSRDLEAMLRKLELFQDFQNITQALQILSIPVEVSSIHSIASYM